jgi:hypothetical protein
VYLHKLKIGRLKRTNNFGIFKKREYMKVEILNFRALLKMMAMSLLFFLAVVTSPQKTGSFKSRKFAMNY